jgi:hypothetical protein
MMLLGKTQKELDDEKARQEKEKEIAEAKQYLNETDWYIMREMEGCGKMPKEIKDKRAVSRKKADRASK